MLTQSIMPRHVRNNDSSKYAHAGPLHEEDVFDEGKARRDAINGFENVWTNWMELAATIDWAVQGCVKNSPLWKSVDVENATKNNRGVRQYPLVHLLQLDVLPVYELIIKSPTAVCRPRFLGAAGLERRLGGRPLD